MAQLEEWRSETFLTLDSLLFIMWRASHYEQDSTRCGLRHPKTIPKTLCSDTKFVTTREHPLVVTGVLDLEEV